MSRWKQGSPLARRHPAFRAPPRSSGWTQGSTPPGASVARQHPRRRVGRDPAHDPWFHRDMPGGDPFPWAAHSSGDPGVHPHKGGGAHTARFFAPAALAEIPASPPQGGAQQSPLLRVRMCNSLEQHVLRDAIAAIPHPDRLSVPVGARPWLSVCCPRDVRMNAYRTNRSYGHHTYSKGGASGLLHSEHPAPPLGTKQL